MKKLRILLAVLLLGLTQSFWPACNSGEEPPRPAPLQAPQFPPWKAPPTSRLERMIATEPLCSLPPLELAAPAEELVADIDQTIADWTPGAKDRWNDLRWADLKRWGDGALFRMEKLLRDGERPWEERRALIAKIGVFDNAPAAGVLERVLTDLDLEPELRALAAYEISRLPGDWIDEVLLRKLDLDYQDGHYIKKDYYEPDEYVSIYVAEALASRGLMGGMDYLLDVEQRAQEGALWSIYSPEILRDHARNLLRAVVRRESPAGDPLAAPDAPLDLVRQRSREIFALWRRTGRAPRSAPDFTVQLNSRLALRLARRMLQFRERPLRPVDEARNILVGLGAAALPMVALGLEDPALFVREYSLDVVIRLGPCARSLTPLLLALLGDPLTRCKALEALGSIGEHAERARWQGLVLASDPEVRYAAALALARLAHPASSDVLLEAYRRLGPNGGSAEGAALATALIGAGRIEGLSLWAALRKQIETLDPLMIAPLLERSRALLEKRAIAPAGGSAWPRERDALLEAMRLSAQARGWRGMLQPSQSGR